MNNLIFTIFGGTGDLTFRKLLPALYNLSSNRKLGQDVRIIIIGRRELTHDEYITRANEWIKQYARMPYRDIDFEDFAKQIEYVKMDFTNLEEYQRLNAYYNKHEKEDHIFYLAVAPRFFKVIADGLKYVEHAHEGKVIIEKPFGEDLESAYQLNKALEGFFKKEHIFHIDHYLGKEMVRNLQIIRFMNPMFQDVWNAKYIERIQINAFETVGVESRGDYYDQSGALKDMVQNHLFQILSVVAMEQPNAFFKEDMHQKQLDVLHALRPVHELNMKDNVILGQYFNYQKEARVANDSMTETYASLRLFIDNERWKGMPFIITTGKKLNRREMEIVITFKNRDSEAEPNVLCVMIQPTEGVSFQFNMKKPGDSDEIDQTRMEFCQSCSDSNRINTPEAYERLITAAVNNDTSWFSKWDQIETSWSYIEHLKQRYNKSRLPLYTYMAGSVGPVEAQNLMK